MLEFAGGTSSCLSSGNTPPGSPTASIYATPQTKVTEITQINSATPQFQAVQAATAAASAAAASQAVVLHVAPQRDLESCNASRFTVDSSLTEFTLKFESDLENLLAAEGVELGVRTKVTTAVSVFEQHL